jgi:MoaA/NifB/PqqE/SkfB family radical SAM enzyme
MNKSLRSQLPEKLSMLIYFVTSHCNAKCKTCFYWEELNQRGDLTFSQIEKISRTMPSFSDLWLSGGEPTLRPDLSEIIDLFCVNNGITRISFPTNGLLPERAAKIFANALGNNRQLEIYCNLSLDGLAETHDSIRGVPGNFHRIMESIRVLGELRREFGRRLRINVNTVICRENYQEIAELAEFLKANCQLDGQYFQIVRGQTPDENIKFVPVENLKKIYRHAADSYEYYGARFFDENRPLLRWLKKLAYAGTLTFHNKVQLDSYQNKREWPMRCTAGSSSLVLDYNGFVRACELRPPIAHLKDYQYDFSALWADQRRQQELLSIEQARCSQWCTHVCFLHDSLRHSRRARYYEIPKSYFTRKVW